jgi:hypothetical protein
MVRPPIKWPAACPRSSVSARSESIWKTGHPIPSGRSAASRMPSSASRGAGGGQGRGCAVGHQCRIDLYLKHIGDDETRFAETVRRGQAYIAAGADCVFPFGLTDLKTISELVAALRSPLNIAGRTGMPSIARLDGARRSTFATRKSDATLLTTRCTGLSSNRFPRQTAAAFSFALQEPAQSRIA